ncbi:RNA-directed DNA polymerase, eukaryota, reverse transcriptase zinc-binding domain protein [Tanacetum coccineum]|uniref:Phosphoglycerate kinase n=1 Tax=Tanacetum coccineum TaxID=301880 RepID=A0ABQ5A569_9ASTR
MAIGFAAKPLGKTKLPSIEQATTLNVPTSFRDFLLQKELDYLDGAVSNTKRPFAAIVGDSKVSSKIRVIESLLEKCDILLSSGDMIFTFYKAQDLSVGSSLVEEDKLDRATTLLAKAKGVKLARALTEIWTDAELKDTIVLGMPKLVEEGFYTCTIRVEYELEPPKCACCKVFGLVQDECPNNIDSSVAKNLKKPSQASRGLPNVGYSSTSTRPIVEKIDKIERLIIDGKVTLVDDEGKPLDKVNFSDDHDSEDEVESVTNEMASFLASKKVQFLEFLAYMESVDFVDMRDRWVWSLEGSGEFLVASVRRPIDERWLPEVSIKTLWINVMPIKVNVHAWKVKLDCLTASVRSYHKITTRDVNFMEGVSCEDWLDSGF